MRHPRRVALAAVVATFGAALLVLTRHDERAPPTNRATTASAGSAQFVADSVPAVMSAAQRRLDGLAAARDYAAARPRPARPAAAPPRDTRTFEEMASTWQREPDDPDWTSNMRTFIGALLETMGDASDSDLADTLDVRCRTTTCRVDVPGRQHERMQTLGEVAREHDYPMQVDMRAADGGGLLFETYLGKEGTAGGS